MFGVRFTFPVQTLGFFITLSFLLAYLVFTSEFKRYEKDGKIQSFKQKVLVRQPVTLIDLLVNFALGFAFGFKVIGVAFQFAHFQSDPRGYLLSGEGNWVAGLLAGSAFAAWAYLDRKKHALPQPKLVEQTRHPYQLMGLIVFSVGFFGFIGAKLFDAAEHVDLLMADPIRTIFSTNGYAYYGGLIFGALTYLYIGYRHGMAQVHLADIGSPGMMLAYGIGRIGCQLSGDGDWGIVNPYTQPGWLGWLPNWMWAFKYPHNAINAGISIPGCTGNYCNQLVNAVYPTPFYELTLCIAMFLVMWAARRNIKIPGLMFSIYLILNGGERFLIEHIRINFYYRFLGFTFTQAELLGGLMLLGGLVGVTIILVKRYKKPGRESASS
ncbi:diacylglyceryl transferase [Mucilaginibacter sp. PAMC 26640]|nr:diacylglyceryl transferase [Mucilaginibacter sp. PAMC 26640]